MGKVYEKYSNETYTSKAAMKKHEKGESSKEQAMEGEKPSEHKKLMFGRKKSKR